MYNPNQRPTGTPPCFGDVLETLKCEYDKLMHESNRYKKERDEFDRILQSQLVELSSVHSSIQELERRHTKLKLQYDEDMFRLQNLHRVPNTQGTNAPLPTSTPQPKSNPPFGSVNTFPSLNQGTPDPTVFGFKSALGKRRLDENGAMGPSHSLPRLEVPSMLSSDQTGKNHTANQNRNIHALPPNAHHLQQNSPQPQNQVIQIQQGQIGQIQASIPKEGNKQSLPPAKLEVSGNDAPRVVMNSNVQSDLQIKLTEDLAHNSVVCCVRFSNDGKYLATGCNKQAQIYSVTDGSSVATFSDKKKSGNDLYLRSLCFSPDGQYLACGAEDKTVKLWDIEKREIVHTFTGHNMDIYSVDYSNDGKYIVSGSGDKKARIWDVEQRKCVFSLGNDEVGPKDGVTSVAISPDGKLVAAGSLDRIVRLWDAHTGFFLERYEGHLDSVYSVAFSPDGKTLVSGSLDKTLKLWDIAESRSRAQCRSTFTGHTDFVLSVTYSADGRYLISGSKDRTVQFWDPRNASASLARLEGHKNSVISVAVNPQGGNFATGSGDYKAKLWEYTG